MADGLTAKACDLLGDGKYSDGDGLRLTVRGDTRAWTLLYTAPDGRRREMGLGKHTKTFGLAAARVLAAEMRDKIRRGVDPLEEKIERRAQAQTTKAERKAAAAAAEATLRRVVRTYHQKDVEPELTDKHGKQWLASIENHVPAAILDKPIATIEPAELLDALRPLYVRVPETARRIRQRLDAVFDDAVLRKLATTNPAKIIQRSLRQKRDKGQFRALGIEYAPALFQRLDELPGTAARCLQFAMLTAARTAEVLRMSWDELNGKGDVWTVPAARMKAVEAHVVHLSPAARAILARARGLSKAWVFPSPVRDAPLSNMAMLILLRRLEIQALTTVHGLCRSTFSTWANGTDAARPDVIEACLAHQEGDRVRRAYNRAKFANERRDLLAAWAEYLTAEPKGKKTKRRK
jgi:integrase